VIPCHMAGQLLPHVHNSLHRAMTDESSFAPLFSVGVFGEVALNCG
jgi:hypothetical protein